MVSTNKVKQPPVLNTACLMFSDGNVFYGKGFGVEGIATGELCFNTAMTGYQEIITDPSYAGQIIAFTFPHIGNTGINCEDHEHQGISAEGIIVKSIPTEPSNWRSIKSLNNWLIEQKKIGIGNIDTRRLTQIIRNRGAQNIAISYNKQGIFDLPQLQEKATNFKGLLNEDLAKNVTTQKVFDWDEDLWKWNKSSQTNSINNKKNVIAIDYGAKNNILRCLVSVGCNVTVMPASTKAKEILDLNPDGIFLSNGPGDPAATGKYAVPMIKTILDNSKIPIFGICLGHQLLAIAMGAKTLKMKHGHHGANHPVKNLETGKVEITSMNHGFTVDTATLPEDVIETHISLFDKTNCGIRMLHKPVFSVQYHPEASPGPQDSFYLFNKFVDLM
jgi:carbamoyl-phosphate synthase small subunit